jgi:hypothetical protein
MDKATGFRIVMVLLAAIVVVFIIAIYYNGSGSNKSSARARASLPAASSSSGIAAVDSPSRYASFETFNSSSQPPFVKAQPTPRTPGGAASPSAASTVMPAEDGQQAQYGPVATSGNAGMLDIMAPRQRRLTAEDLLPKDAANTKWAQVTPSGQGELKDLNFMTAGWHIGVNTQGQSLRNANLQIRSEPINPQFKVSPWNMSTVEPDVNRRAFEII